MNFPGTIPETFPAYIVSEDDGGELTSGLSTWSRDKLANYPIDIAIEYSSLNFKDALSAHGHRGISPNLPHIPGIDAAGVRMDGGEPIIITGFDFGMGTPGGFAAFGRVPEEWIIPMPPQFNSRTAMAYGTAGLTAALCVDALRHEACLPGYGPVVVSGATGGVGSIALRILAKLGYEVHAVTGKKDAHDWLKERGADRVIDREEFMQNEKAEGALLRPEYAAAVDTVGGNMLHRILRSLHFEGVVAACGMVGGTELNSNVYPFILRGIKLIGIASADNSLEKKTAMWQQLAGPWSVPDIMDEVEERKLSGLPEAIEKIRKGRQLGRVIIRLS